MLTGWACDINTYGPSQWSGFPKARITFSLVFLYHPHLPHHPAECWSILDEENTAAPQAQPSLTVHAEVQACFLLGHPTSQSQAMPFGDMSVLRHKPAACLLSHWRPPCWHLAHSGKVNTEPRESTFGRNSWGLSKRYRKDDCVFFCFTVVVFLGFALRKWNSLENKQTLPDSSLGITFSCITSTIFTLFEASIDSLGAFKDTQAKVSEDSGPLQSHSGHCPGTWLLPNAPVLPVDRFW